jgi:hypothetical protein
MLRILGSATRLCDGLTRREALRAGGLGFLGLSLPHLLRPAQASAGSNLPGFGRAKSCILLYLYGAPSQLETFDLKPDAPADVRSQFRPIATSVPGVQICEHLPRTARVLDRATLVRSLTSPYNIHNVAYVLSGTPTTDIPMELNPRDTRHWPCFGSVLDYLSARDGKARAVPTQVALPWKFSSRSEPFRRGGPFGGFLGTGFDPVWAEYHGTFATGDPYRGVEADLRFQLSKPGAAEITLDRLHRRRSLLEQFDRARGRISEDAVARGFDRQQQLALQLVTSSRTARALDVEREPRALRERYGQTLFGQSALAARRLIEAGVRLATVFWDEFREANSAWDTHVRQESRLKDELCPGFDLAYSALIEDLEARGLLDETLVVVLSEHGRTPKLSKTPGGGREHWSGAFCALLAGGGVRRGSVLGATDRIAGFPKESPVSPKDVLATIYHLLGVDPETLLQDREGRPVPLAPGGRVLAGVLA